MDTGSQMSWRRCAYYIILKYNRDDDHDHDETTQSYARVNYVLVFVFAQLICLAHISFLRIEELNLVQSQWNHHWYIHT